MISPAPKPAEKVADLMIAAGVAIAAIAPIILLIEIVEWAFTGHWPGWSVEDGLLFFGIEEPLAHFDIILMALDIIVDLPLTIGVYLAGLATFILATDAVDPVQRSCEI